MKIKRLENLGVSPAPWFTIDDETLVCRWIDEEESVLSDVADCGRAADAALIAAAPELYEALRLVLDTLEHYGFQPWFKDDPLAVAVKCGEKALEKAGGVE